MNTRLLELIENPDLIQSADLKLLNDQIKATPYVQSLRALALLAASRFDPENYQQVLSTTAAYTTDKKILYQLVNGNASQLQEVSEHADERPDHKEHVKPETAVVADHSSNDAVGNSTEDRMAHETVAEPIVNAETVAEEAEPVSFTEITPVERAGPQPVYVNGELNRILFEGEENFLEQETPVIDKEASAESGQLVLADANLAAPKVFSEESAPVSELAAREEEVIQSSKQDKEAGEPEQVIAEEAAPAAEVDREQPPAADVSFHGIDPFLPQVKIGATPKKEGTASRPAPVSNKHEEEMQRLIAEVERKIKEKKAAEVQNAPLEEEAVSTEISFSDTQDFVVKAETPTNGTVEPAKEEISDREKASIETESTDFPESDAAETVRSSEPEAETPPVTSGWKPMTVPSHTPDALLKTESIELNVQPENLSEIHEKSVKIAQETPVAEQQPSEMPAKPVKKESVQRDIDDDSNVPQFINTWQSWLKIDRKEVAPAAPSEPEEDRKTVIIEKFIETAPRISQLREEGSFVIKEKKSDISHLMTETLANIYVEQKLYARAIQAFHILAEKHPQKADYFKSKVKEVRDLRNNFQ